MSKGKFSRATKPEHLEQIAARFRILGEPMRLRILQALCGKSLTVNEIVAATGATQANISKHLSLMATAGVLIRDKQGQCVYYAMKDQMVVKMCELVHSQLVS